MHLPELIKNSLARFAVGPPSFEQFMTRKGSIEIKAITVHFPPYPRRLTDPNLPKTYGSKPLVKMSNEVLFGELAILSCLRKAGFDGVWIDTFHGRDRNKVLWTDMPPNGPKITLDQEADRLYDRIVEKNLTKKGRVTSGGFFDLFAWKDGEFVFLEYKGKGDSIRPTQRRWINAVISNGLAKPEQLFFVFSQNDP